MIKEVNKILGKKNAAGIDISDNHSFTLFLKGDIWDTGPIENEDKWLKFLLKQKKAIQIDVAGCSRLSIYTFQWIIRLSASLKSQNLAFVLLQPNAWVKKQITILGIKDKDLGIT